jgi:hypothetical protein
MINAYDGPKTEPWFDDFGDFNTVRPQGDALYKESMREMSDKIAEDCMAKEPYYLEWKAWVEEAYPGQTIGPMSTSALKSTLNSTWVNDFNKAVGMKPTVAIADDVPPTASESQVDGEHYVELGVQPLEATYQNFGYAGLRAAIYTKVGKYLTREKGTHRKDITKAIHCLELQLEYYDKFIKSQE